MSHVIRITSVLYEKIKIAAKSFETPSDVIERIIWEQSKEIERLKTIIKNNPAEIKHHIIYPKD